MARTIRWTRMCVGECGWMLLSVALATVFVAAFVFFAEAPAGTLVDALRQPVNVVRVVVLSAALWVWAYIARVICSTGRGDIGRGLGRA